MDVDEEVLASAVAVTASKTEGGEVKSVLRKKDQNSSSRDSMWRVFGHRVPRKELVFCCQMGIIFIVVVSSIYNLSKGHGQSELWTALLSSCLGYILPNPQLKGQ